MLSQTSKIGNAVISDKNAIPEIQFPILFDEYWIWRKQIVNVFYQVSTSLTIETLINSEIRTG